jgi:hypothetical protein
MQLLAPEMAGREAERSDDERSDNERRQISTSRRPFLIKPF